MQLAMPQNKGQSDLSALGRASTEIFRVDSNDYYAVCAVSLRDLATPSPAINTRNPDHPNELKWE
jgi:hypothetical protein